MYLEPSETSEMELFAKIVTTETHSLFSQKAPAQMFVWVLIVPLKTFYVGNKSPH